MDSLNEIWQSVTDTLSEQITPTAMKTWFRGSQAREINGSCLMITTTGEYKKQVISERFAPMIIRILSDIFSSEFELMVLTDDEYESYIEAKPDSKTAFPEMAGYTFDRFVVGPSNKMAHAASLAVAKNPGIKYNPLFIYGNSGLGKTHLLLSIGQYIQENFPDKRIEYIKGDDFTNELVKSIREGSAESFRMKYRNADLLLVDDIQFIAGKQQTQVEFFNTFNNMYEANHQIVITSDRPPAEMSTLDDRLRTRFEGGLMVDIAPPDFETRVAITKNKAFQLGLCLSDDAVNFIASNIKSNIRQLEGVIKRLTAYKEILDTNIDIESVKRAINDLGVIGEYIPKPGVIIQETAKYYGLKEEDIRGQNRSKNTAEARQVAMYLIRTLTNLTLIEIGAEFGARNHATVLSSIRKIEDIIKDDCDIACTVRDITSNINSNK